MKRTRTSIILLSVGQSVIAFIHAFYAERSPEPGSPNDEKQKGAL